MATNGMNDDLEVAQHEPLPPPDTPIFTDAELHCDACGHAGLDRTMSWPGVILDASEEGRATGALPIPPQRMRTITRTKLCCPHCGACHARADDAAKTQRAKAELIVDRMQTSLPIDNRDLKLYMMQQVESLYAAGELLWTTLEPHIAPVHGFPGRHYVALPGAPHWVNQALVHLESTGWIEGVSGEVFKRLPEVEIGANPFCEPLLEHTEFSRLPAH